MISKPRAIKRKTLQRQLAISQNWYEAFLRASTQNAPSCWRELLAQDALYGFVCVRKHSAVLRVADEPVEILQGGGIRA